MKNINKLIRNSDFSINSMLYFYDWIASISNSIAINKKQYVEGKKQLTDANARLIRSIIADDYEAQNEAEHAIVQIVDDLRRTRERIKRLTIMNQRTHNCLLKHQKKDENVYIQLRKQALKHSMISRA
ncbi:hypothetical protein N7T98_26080, partial [Pseudomonas syringae pv. tomato]|uniref:hypothetical protein n=1 Tax=Pseudomonas syringae group genomosp. 3 TaxID=251701 RepID=UPI0022A67FFE